MSHPHEPHELLRLHADDNVAVATRPLSAGQVVHCGELTLTLAEEVPLGHKVAVAAIDEGSLVIKYGHPIGIATAAIAPGQHVHSHNLTAGEHRLDAAASSAIPPPPEPLADRTFEGFRRGSGRAGTRNYVAVISTVNCSASVSKSIVTRFDRTALARYENIDGLVAFTHGGGCGMQFGGEVHQTLNRVLGGIARHPNIGAYLLIGLGCEQGTMGYLLDDQRLVQIDGATSAGQRNGRPPVFSLQDCGGTQATLDAGLAQLAELLPRANDVRREPLPLAHLIVGTECGGSDGASGITANPALGVAADMVVAAGGTVILGETPEIFGAEQLLTRRARTPVVAQALLDRLAWWQDYTGRFGVELDNNPSPGNKEGGLTTIYEKALGAVAKGGSTALEAVYQYAEPVTSPGLVVMDTPGYDPVSVTGMVAGGANVVVFTTGRGSCFGCKPTPSLKVATNTPMYERMRDDMDLSAGEILAGRPVAEVGREIFEAIVATASGRPTRSEQLGLGDEEFVPWQPGPVL
ncbi:MAG: altronate dehydratase [Planctomycetota bacterium]|nr:MAG: altronate dehydratase [Planctomycetota bacterium]REJ96848.1 MAG: altronate dehydratase [Planctomycetota bacterium]REK24037.1 MAG: altronate dehydratase [Planctomycetota bacterium]REK39368.1 MAG: altronate dehydratase [Planctomycetota bacterium]